MSAIPAPTAPAASLVSLRTRLDIFSHWFLRPEVLIRVVVYLTALIYLRTLLFDYVYDDNYLIILNPWMDSWRSVPTFFTHSFWSFTDAARSVDFYRPLVMLMLASIHHLLGPAPGWFHLVSAGLHVVATYLTYRLAIETIDDHTTAAIAAGLFGLHPTKVETAAWISGISDSLCVVFFLGSIIAYFKWRKQRESEDRPTYLWISVSLLLLALFSKEAAIFAPLLIGIYEVAWAKTSFRKHFRTTLISIWPFAAVTLLVIAIRILIVRMPTGHMLSEIPLLSTLFTAPQTILWYLSKQLWPLGLSVEYPVLALTRPSLAGFVLPLCGLTGLLMAVIWMVRKSATGIFFTSWFLLMIAPVILYQVRLQQHDRYFYLASVATSVGLASLVAKFKQFGEKFQAFAVITIFAVLATLTFNYSSYWDNDLKLFTRAIQIAPHNSKACRYLAGFYINSKQPEKADAIAQSLMSDPEGRATGWYILGTVRLAEKDNESARKAMQKAVDFSTPGHDLLLVVGLAEVDMLLNRNEEAAELYRKQLREYPEMAYLNHRLAIAEQNIRKSDEAPTDRKQIRGSLPRSESKLHAER